MKNERKILFEVDNGTIYDLNRLWEHLTYLFGGTKVGEMAPVPRDMEDAEMVRYYFQVGSYRVDEEPESMVTFRCPARDKEGLECAANERGITVSELLREFAASKRV